MRRYAAISAVLVLALLAVASASASHAWGNYHWARTSNPFTVDLGDNLSTNWKSYLSTASGDWSQSTVLDTQVVAGGSSKRHCGATSGRVEVCNDTYGYNGWLGVAQIWTSGDHITQGTVKLNDSYFNSPSYDDPSWRQMVVCQEVGHTFGLDHQDETFDNPNLGTCMDYTSNPDGPPSNLHPNKHDYDELELIYTSHYDTGGSGGSCHGKSCHSKGGAPVELDNDLWVEDLGNGIRRFTHVLWVNPGAPHGFPRGASS